VRISHDGSRALFVSEVETPGTGQVFLWEPGVGVTRISSTSAGDPAGGEATIGNYVGPFAGEDIFEWDNHHTEWTSVGRVWTNDLQTVFFQSDGALVPEDRNEVSDVYAWRDGDVELISPGTPGRLGFYYHASSADGSTVFFHTSARVLPAGDRNAVRDIYAARIGGGFPEPPRPDTVGDPPPPSGAAPAPPPPGVGSGSAREGEQTSPGRRSSLSARKLGATATRGLARRGRVGVNVRMSRAGQVRVRALARVGGRTRTVGRASKRLRSGRVVVRLSKAARTQLRRKRKLGVTLVVSSGGGVSERVRVTLTLPSTGAASGSAVGVDQSKRG